MNWIERAKLRAKCLCHRGLFRQLRAGLKITFLHDSLKLYLETHLILSCPPQEHRQRLGLDLSADHCRGSASWPRGPIKRGCSARDVRINKSCSLFSWKQQGQCLQCDHELGPGKAVWGMAMARGWEGLAQGWCLPGLGGWHVPHRPLQGKELIGFWSRRKDKGQRWWRNSINIQDWLW